MIRYNSKSQKIIATLVVLFAVGGVYASEHKIATVDVTFSFFGCNRLEAKDAEDTREVNPSTANVPQLRQNIIDIAKIGPDFAFFGGDLVMGYADDKGDTLKGQMSSWIDLVHTLPHNSKTKYVALTGNHELNRKKGAQKLPNPLVDGVWSELVKSANLIPAEATGPTPENDAEDKLVSNQSALNFSFNRGSVHFVCLNTDTRVTTKDDETGETKIAMVPVHWLDRDLDGAQADTKIKCIVVMGHRNLIDPAEGKGDAPIDPECAVPMVKSLENHSKVRAYVCAHVHALDVAMIGKSGLKQLIYGNGGSQLEKGWKPVGGRTFGFGYFRCYSDGSLGVVSYLRPEPKDYMDASPKKVPPALPEKEMIIPVR